MFRLTDLHLFGVIGMAIATAGIGLWLIRRGSNRTFTGDPVDVRRKAWQPGVFSGGLVLGAGWALTGACPVFGRLRSFGDRPGLASEPHPA
jgi:hypothetical protein